MKRHPSTSRRRNCRVLARAIYNTPLVLESKALDNLVSLLQTGHQLPIHQADILTAIGSAAAQPAQPVGQIVILPLYGLLLKRESWYATSTDAIGRLFDRCVADVGIRAIVLDVNSPGGTPEGCAELAQKIFEARGNKPIYALANPTCASGGYWIASAADTVIVLPSGNVGSIGSLCVHTETSEADKLYGVKRTVIVTGKHKADENPFEPLSAQGRQTIQERIDGVNAMFVAAVARHRGITPAKVDESYGQGKTFMGQLAVDAGLADRVGTLDSLLAELGANGAPTPIAIQTAAGGPAASVTSLPASIHSPPISQETTMPPVTQPTATNPNPDPSATVVPVVVAQTPAPQAPTADLPVVVTPGTTVQHPVHQSPAEIQTTAILAERTRCQELRARAVVLGVEPTMVEAAIDSGISVQTALMQWTDKAAHKEPPVTRTDTQVTGGTASAQKIHDQAMAALCMRVGLKTDYKGANSLAHRRLNDIARVCLEAAGIRTEMMSEDDVACHALAMGQDHLNIRVTAGSNYARPGDYANILSGLANKILDDQMELCPATYSQWAKQMTSVDDFLPHVVNRIGETGEFPHVPDGDDFTDTKPGAEMNWIAADAYGREMSFTPAMQLGNDMGAFDEALRGFVDGHELTLNRLCVNLLTGNATAGDGLALYHATHANIVTGGGIPSQAQMAKMRTLFRAMTGVSALNKISLTLAGILVPEALETDAEQTLDPQRVAVPTADTGINTWKGKATWWVEPMLTDTSAAVYYGFADKRRAAAIAYCYQTGYERMRTRIYFNNKNNARVVQVEGRFGAAVNNWRGSVRNPGS